MVQIKLLTIVAEALITKRILADLERMGVSGYSISEVRGKGESSIDASEWEGRNRRIETLIPEKLANEIIELLQAEYFEDYSVVVFTTDVSVVRSEKFKRKSSS